MAWKAKTLFCAAILAGGLQAQSGPAAGAVTVSDEGTVPTPPTSVPLVPDPHISASPAAAERFWASAEYLLWWVRGDRLPPLVTTSTPGVPLAQAGQLGAPGTAVLFGDDRVNNDARSGARLGVGCWLDDCQRLGVGVEGFWLEDLGDGFAATSAGTPVLARPIFNTATGLADAQISAFPGVAGSTLAVSSDSSLCGVGAFARTALCRSGCGWEVDGLVGYRYLNLDEEVRIDERLVAADATGGAPPIGTVFTLNDTYRTRNQFHGADLGLAGRLTSGRCFVDVMGKVAVGCNSRSYTVGGWSQTAVPGLSPVTTPGGLYTVGLAGRTSDQVFAVVPEFRLNLGYRLTDNVSVFGGYTLLGWTNVARPGDQISLDVNPAQLPPALTPVVPRPVAVRDSTLWVQGLSVGVAISY